MATLILIRHAENDLIGKTLAGRMAGVHLNETGRKHAQALAVYLADKNIKAIFSSPLERAIETAAPLAQAAGLEIKSHPGLLETDFGEWQGRPMPELRQLPLWKTVREHPSQMQFPGGERLDQAQDRIVNTIREINADHAEDDIIACFSHSDPIRLAIAYFSGMPLDCFQRVVIDPASITTFKFNTPIPVQFFHINHAIAADYFQVARGRP